MQKFTIFPNTFLKIIVFGFYNSNYYKGDDRYADEESIESLIWSLKNDNNEKSTEELKNACQKILVILEEDIAELFTKLKKDPLTICIVPRAKAESNYQPNQLLFKKTISAAIKSTKLSSFNFVDGTNYIIRHTDTKTTHLSKKDINKGGTGEFPSPGITNKTCAISDEVFNKDILLIDDLYTRDVGIIEDAIQALIDKGAKSVVFYSLGKMAWID